MNRTYVNVGLAGLGLVLLLGFNNCQATKDSALNLETDTANSLTPAEGIDGVTGTLCEQDIKRSFGRSWYEFSRTNCATCHATGPGKGRFASSNINTAYDEFMLIGFDKVGKNATNPNHNPPFTGTQHFMEINSYKVEWLKNLEKYSVCSGDYSVAPTEPQIDKISISSTEKEIGLTADNQTKVISWTINNDIKRQAGKPGNDPNIPGGVFSISVGRYKNSAGATYYTFFSPTLNGQTVDVNVNGLFVSLNGLLLKYPSTFSFLNVDVRKIQDIVGDNKSTLVSGGSLVAPKYVVPGDTLSVSFIDLKQISLPPPPEPNYLNISSSNTNIIGTGETFKDITLSLTRPAEEPIVVSMSENTDLCGTNFTITNDNSPGSMKKLGTGCLPSVYAAICPGGGCSDEVLTYGRSRSNIGSTFNRFDWDHKFTNLNVTFMSGEQTKTIRIDFSTNIRKEVNRVLTMEVSSINGAGLLGPNITTHFAVRKYNNPDSTPGVQRYSELMDRRFGILGLNCVKCHNSTDNAGGYDMTNYDMMVTNGVLVPSVPTASKMYFRMNPSLGNLAKPMPLDGFRPLDQVIEIEKWILDGAKNN
jgi:hypothetical protein